MNIAKYIKEAIKLSQESFDADAFPAGGLVVENNEVVSSSISGIYPKINNHAESFSIDIAMEKLNKQLTDCILFSSMEPCLMCLSKAYWAGIRRFYFAIKKENTNHNHYESTLVHDELIKSFNHKMELIHVKEFEEEALKIVRKWEEINM